MTCKDCIHYPICQRFTELGYSITEERKDLEAHCKFFEERPRWHYELPCRRQPRHAASGGEWQRCKHDSGECRGRWLLHGKRHMVPRRLSGNRRCDSALLGADAVLGG